MAVAETDIKEKVKAAAKAVRSTKAHENFILVEISYDQKLILPYSDGIALLNALQNAEALKENYGSKPSIAGLERNAIRSAIFSRSEYEHIKIANLLNVSIDDVKNAELSIT